VRGEKPLNGQEPWTWLRGETNPSSPSAEQTVEGLGKLEDGTKREAGISRAMWTRLGDAAKRAETPVGQRSDENRTAGDEAKEL
jgi:hypothetical protein